MNTNDTTIKTSGFGFTPKSDSRRPSAASIPRVGPIRSLAARPDRVQVIKPHPVTAAQIVSNQIADPFSTSQRAERSQSMSGALARSLAPIVFGVPALALLAVATPLVPILIGVQVMSIAAVGGFLALHTFQMADDLLLANQNRGDDEIADRPGYTSLGRFIAAVRSLQGRRVRLRSDDVIPAELFFPPKPIPVVALPVLLPPGAAHESPMSLVRLPTLRPPLPR